MYQPILVYCLSLILWSCNQAPQNSAGNTGSYFEKQVDEADNMVDSGYPVKAFHFIDSSLAAQSPITVKDRFKYYKFYCGYYYQHANDFEKAMRYADSLELLLENVRDKANYTRELAEAKYSKGDILFRQQKYSEAYQNYFNAKQIGKTSLDPCNLADYSYRMGMILYKQAHHRTASRYFIQSFKETSTCADNFTFFYRRQELLNNTALSYYKAGAVDSALVFYKKAFDYISANGKKYPGKAVYMEIAKGVIYGNEAQIYNAQGDFARAESLFRKSISINLQKGYDNGDAQLAQLHLAGLYLSQHKIEQMLTLLNLVKAEMGAQPIESVRLEWNHLMWQYSQLNNKPADAFSYLLAYTKLKDSIANRVRGLTETDVDEQLKNLEDQYENQILKKGNEVKSLYLKVALLATVLSLVIIFLVFRNWRTSRHNVRSLTTLNNQIVEQKLKLEQTLEELELRSKEKDRILRAVAHDLRNPIGGVASLSGVVLDEPGISEEQKEMISLIQSTCLDALQLINEILELAVIENINNMPKEKVDVNMLLSNTIELLRFKAEEKNQKLLLDALEEPEQILINREKIGRVINNLISNAIKFSPSGADISIFAATKGGSVQIAVQDKGIGIPDAIKSKIFDTFTEAKRLGTSGEKPFGLGLSISRQIIEAHQGKIWFESEAGTGSTFYIELKRSGAEKAPDALLLSQSE